MSDDSIFVQRRESSDRRPSSLHRCCDKQKSMSELCSADIQKIEIHSQPRLLCAAADRDWLRVGLPTAHCALRPPSQFSRELQFFNTLYFYGLVVNLSKTINSEIPEIFLYSLNRLAFFFPTCLILIYTSRPRPIHGR